MKDEKYCARLLDELAKSTKTEVGPMMFRIMMTELSKNPWEQVAQALEKCFLNLKRFPTVVEIQEHMGVRQPDKGDEANDIVGRIIFAIARFSGYKPEEAKEHIGEIGWEAVERNGGWELICNMNEDQLNIFRAQMRDQVKAISAMDSVGRLDQPKNFDRLPSEVIKLLDGQR